MIKLYCDCEESESEGGPLEVGTLRQLRGHPMIKPKGTSYTFECEFCGRTYEVEGRDKFDPLAKRPQPVVA